MKSYHNENLDLNKRISLQLQLPVQLERQNPSTPEMFLSLCETVITDFTE